MDLLARGVRRRARARDEVADATFPMTPIRSDGARVVRAERNGCAARFACAAARGAGLPIHRPTVTSLARERACRHVGGVRLPCGTPHAGAPCPGGGDMTPRPTRRHRRTIETTGLVRARASSRSSPSRHSLPQAAAAPRTRATSTRTVVHLLHLSRTLLEPIRRYHEDFLSGGRRGGTDDPQIERRCILALLDATPDFRADRDPACGEEG